MNISKVGYVETAEEVVRCNFAIITIIAAILPEIKKTLELRKTAEDEGWIAVNSHCLNLHGDELETED